MSPAQINVCDYFSDAEIEQMARASGFVERSSPISGFKLLMTFSVGALAVPDGTLSQFAAYLWSSFGVRASPQAVHERIDASSAEFMRLCLAKAIAISLRPLPLKRSLVESFSHIYIIDSTNFQLAPALAKTFKGAGGASSPAAMRVQLVVDYITGILHIELGDATLNDAPTLERIVASGILPRDGACLFLQDLGYFKTATFGMIASTESQYFLSKPRASATLRSRDGEIIELERVLRDGLDIPVWLGSSQLRLLARRLPDDVAEARIRKAEEAARRKRRGPVSSSYRRILHFAVFLTNLPQEFDMERLHTLYRIRWQIELVFKSWKSILKVHKIRSSRPERVLCEVCGKLVVAALASMACSLAEAILDGQIVSSYKAFKHLRVFAGKWSQTIIASAQDHTEFLSSLAAEIARLCKKSSRGKTPTLETRLRNARLKCS